MAVLALITVPVKVQVDLEVWKEAYGQETIEEARADAKEHLANTVKGAADAAFEMIQAGAKVIN